MTDDVNDRAPAAGADDTPANEPHAEGHPGGDPPTTETVAALRGERDELRDRLLRTAAEFDNYRKRTDRERRDLIESAAAGLIEDLLPVVDDLERALDAAADDAAAAAYRRGVELIHRQLLDLLRRRGVEAIEAVGQIFDPEWHEAVAREPLGDHQDGEITAELRRGYRIGNRLLRPASVRVASA